MSGAAGRSFFQINSMHLASTPCDSEESQTANPVALA